MNELVTNKALKVRIYRVGSDGTPLRDVRQRFSQKRSKILKRVGEGDTAACYRRAELDQLLSRRYCLVGLTVKNGGLARSEKGVRKVGQRRIRKVVRQLNVVGSDKIKL